MVKHIIIICSIVMTATTLSAQSDSAVVRIRTDVDSVVVRINDQELTEDSYGNALIRNSWFIVNLPIDTCAITITAPGYDPIDSTISLVEGEIYTFDVRFTEAQLDEFLTHFQELSESSGGVRIVLRSEPDSCTLVIGSNSIEKSTPAELFVKPGEFSFLATREGFDPLRASVKIDPGVPILANFMLKSRKPALVTPESLGLTYLSQEQMIDVKAAERTRIRFKSLTESFVIFPLAQGILARIVVGKSQRGAANAMILAGVTLTVGSHLLGKILYKRKKLHIEEENLRRQMDNAQVDVNNAQVNQIVSEENIARNKAWTKKNRNTGKVEIESIEDIP